MLVHCKVTPSIKFADTHLYLWVEGGTEGVKFCAQEHNTMSLAELKPRLPNHRQVRPACLPVC